MGSLYFPQLSSGALAQYPIKKYRLVRTIKNVLPDGSMILMSDSDGARLVWQMLYTELSIEDVQALQDHFSVCTGPYHAFTFIDPTDNMLSASTDFTAAAWQTSNLIQVTTGVSDPDGGTGACTATNMAQAVQQISQTLAVPAWYQYCLSLYARSNQPSQLMLTRTGESDTQNLSCSIGSSWGRIVSSGQLADAGTALTISISLAAGQQIELYGPQLEAQIAPSRYRPTQASGGIYANAHWGVSELPVSADAPNLFSTTFTIETGI